MIKHYITKYVENDDMFVESWLQIGKHCFSFRRIKIKLIIAHSDTAQK